MLKILVLIGSCVCLSFYIYGVIFKVLNTEKNECHMTYMFEYPFFGRIKFRENAFYPKYGLYAYSEGVSAERIQARIFNGAPVIFIPGNGGSYKQARSLASVALRKAIDMNWRKSLDYFTVDLNGELSGIYGGYLDDQKNFVKLCIVTVLNLYKHAENKPTQVILIGHSMGGKIAQSLLADNDIAKHINTILTLATPVDEPVVNLDFYINSFYNDINNFLDYRRSIPIVTNETNYCNNYPNAPNALSSVSANKAMLLDNKLLISIGGGSRDFLVHESLTQSKFSDINVLTTSIPNVWVSTDHLCTVWCLQLILVINRFLFSLLSFQGKINHRKSLNFIEDKSEKLEKAEHFFLNPSLKYLNEKEDFMQITQDQSDWFEHSKRSFVESFPNGINKTRIQMIRLLNDFQHSIVSIETINVDVDDWIFGCPVTEVLETERFCSKLIRLPYVVEKLPFTKNDRHFITLDLEEIRHQRPDWTHVLLYIRRSKQKMKLQVDIYGRGDRLVTVKPPEWYAFYKNVVHSMSISGKSYYKISLPAITEAYQTLQLKVNQIDCPASTYHALAKVCVPWSKGCNRYRFLIKENEYIIDIYSPLSKPMKYNTFLNPVTVELYLDSKCKYDISFENSFGGMASRIVQQHYHRFPSYVLALLIVILQNQLSSNFNSVTGKFSMIPMIQSFFFTIAPLILIRFLQLFEISVVFISKNQSSFLVSITMSGAALAAIQISSVFLWFNIICFTKLLRLFSNTIAQLKMRVVLEMKKLLPVVSLILVSCSLVSCGGMIIICACLIYFLLILNEYETYLTLIRQNGNKSSQKIKTCTEGKNMMCDSSKNTWIENSQIFKNLKTENELDDLIKQTLLIRTEKNRESDKCYKLIKESLDRIHVHITLFMMLVVLTSLNIPSTICWIKNFRFASILTPDPSLRPTILSLVCLSFIWQLPLPKQVGICHPLYWLCHFCTLFCIIYCQNSVFYLNFMIGFVFAMINLSQIIA